MNFDKTLKDLAGKLEKTEIRASVERVGTIKTLADGVAKIIGLTDVAAGEILEFEHGIFGVALNLEEEEIGAIVLGDYLKLKEGDPVRGSGRLLSIPVGEEFLGRVIDPLGQPLDGKGPIKANQYYPLEKLAPGVVDRQPVNTPLQTGIKAIDSMIPIGRGQRELIIGDRGIGKTAIAIDTILNQTDVFCIYVAIGQKKSRIAQVVNLLEKHGALKHTIVVSADASTVAPLQYLAPYAGCALGEYFMEKGQDAVIFYDDLSKHAWAYREISLVLKRPSGREAYPGDVFYLHSRLLERACRLNSKLGGGSLTAFPIIETQAGDISAYIPTNVISITDGQIYLEADLFHAGIKPAINAGASVSRVGGAAQTKAMKKVAGRLRLDLAQYRELSAFVQFASDLDEKTRAQIDKGARMIEILKQDQYQPMPLEEQVAVIWTAASGLCDHVPTTAMRRLEKELLEYLHDYGNKVLADIKKERLISEKTEKDLRKVVEAFIKKRFSKKEGKEEKI